MFKILKGISRVFSSMNKFLGWILSPFKISWGDESVEKHPKLNRLYEKGFGSRLLLFFLSLIFVGASLIAEFFFYSAIFEGNWTLIIVLIIFAICLRYPTNFCSSLCGIGFYHFKTGVGKTIKKVTKRNENKPIDSNNSTETSDTENPDQNTTTQPIEGKPKTRSFPSLIFCIVEGLFTIAIPLGLFVIPFSVAVWFK